MSAHFTISFSIRMEGRNMQDRMREAYTMALDQIPRPSTVLIEDWSLDIDSKAVKRRRKEKEMLRTLR